MNVVWFCLNTLRADPCEMINLIDDEPERTEALRGDLFGWVEQNLSARPDPMPLQLARVEEVRGRPHRFL